MEMASKKNNFHYNKNLKRLAIANRKNMTKSAACMWKYVLGQKQMLGYQFRRERPILNYIVDFVCFEIMLVVEVDGLSHEIEENISRDIQRDKVLAEIGFTTLRYSSWEILNRIPNVAESIAAWIESSQADRQLSNRSTP